MHIIVKRRDVDVQHQLPSELHPRLQQIYSSRGVTKAIELERGLERLIPFYTLSQIDQAVELLFQAIKEQQRLMIIGDFDADGATSTAVAVKALRVLGAMHVNYVVPNRFEFGYGLTPEIVHLASDWKPDLLITVDNGISSNAGVAAANAKGMRVIITDHHLPGSVLPDAAAIVNPNQINDLFPSKCLAGVGVIFYVMLALRSYMRKQQCFQQSSEPNMAQFLDLVALGTVADLVPLDQNNRILVHNGLKRIRQGYACPGINALLQISKRNVKKINAADLGFAIAPRLNAAGRLDDMSLGIECLLATEQQYAQKLANQLDQLNCERRVIELNMHKKALDIVECLKIPMTKQLPFGLCLYEPVWHQGVIGIVAGRIKDKVHRPVIAFADSGNDVLKGSARSIKGVHIRDVLDAIAKKNPNLLNSFGGHAMAAGLALPKQNLQSFTMEFDAMLRNLITEKDLQNYIYSDGELNRDDFSIGFAHLLNESGPWGQAFPEPLFDGTFQIIEQRIIAEKHLKLQLMQEDSSSILNAIVFNVDLHKWPNYRCDRVHIVYRLNINDYMASPNLQLMVEHIMPK